MSFNAHVKVKGRWVRLKLKSLEAANEVVSQWRERGFTAFVEASGG